MVMTLVPCDELDDIDEMPAMVESWRSMMPATEAAMVSALAPGRVAVTAMVGKSTRGSAETGSSRKPKMPNAMIDAVISVVMTGRRMQSSESVIGSGPGLFGARLDLACHPTAAIARRRRRFRRRSALLKSPTCPARCGRP